MTIKTLISHLFLINLVLINHAFSQTSVFEGVDLGAGIGYQSTSGVASILDSAQGMGTVNDAKNSSVAGSLGLSYTMLVKDALTIGSIIETNPLKLRAGSTATVPPTGYTVQSYEETFKNVYSFSLEPGYAVGDSFLIYSKIGFSSALEIFNSNDGSANSSAQIKGHNFGLGLRGNAGAFYPFYEVNFIKFNTITAPLSNGTGTAMQSGSAYNLLIGLGYHF